MSIRPLLLVLLISSSLLSAEPPKITFESADTRLRRAHALAQETNDETIVEKVLEYRDGVKRAFGRKDLVAAERLVRDAESVVGLEDGGTTMQGLKVAQLDAPRQKDLAAFEGRLAQVMNGSDSATVVAVVADCVKLLGENAGLPDVRRKGDKDKVVPVKPKDVAEIFLKVIQVDPRSLKALSSGKPVGDTLARGYASVVEGCLTIRPLVMVHFADKLEVLDRLIHGCCTTMISLQIKEGYFKFPDLRGKNIRFGEMIERALEKNPDGMQDGWLVIEDPEGSTKVDADECGVALLRAGTVLKNDAWKQAGLKAADWAMAAPLVSNSYFNAFTVNQLCEAYVVAKDKKYLDAAWKKYEFGVAPCQTSNGRWFDPRSARTVNHVIFLRSLHDLLEASPDGDPRASVEKAARKAAVALLEEADQLGAPLTSHTVQELERHMRLTKDWPAKTREALEHAASAAVLRCTSGGKIRPGSSLPELAAASLVWKN